MDKTIQATKSSVVAKFQGLPFKGDSFDLIIANLMPSHVRDLMAAVQALTYVTRPGGTSVAPTNSPLEGK
jgi:ubiquinone/menaquinone biosynthesis C-methylase UbiE